jgi:hypothetical protein
VSVSEHISGPVNVLTITNSFTGGRAESIGSHITSIIILSDINSSEQNRNDGNPSVVLKVIKGEEIFLR